MREFRGDILTESLRRTLMRANPKLVIPKCPSGRKTAWSLGPADIGTRLAGTPC